MVYCHILVFERDKFEVHNFGRAYVMNESLMNFSLGIKNMFNKKNQNITSH